MADLTIRRNEGDRAPTRGAQELARPFRIFRDLLRWDPFQEMAPLWQAGWPGLEQMSQFNPAFEVKETKDVYSFKADLPGVKEQDIEISTTGNRMTVSGSREEEKKDQSETYYSYERSYGSFSRSFTLPEGADLSHANAELKSGVLTITVPKAPGAQARKITVNAAPEKAPKA